MQTRKDVLHQDFGQARTHDSFIIKDEQTN